MTQPIKGPIAALTAITLTLTGSAPAFAAGNACKAACAEYDQAILAGSTLRYSYVTGKCGAPADEAGLQSGGETSNFVGHQGGGAAGTTEAKRVSDSQRGISPNMRVGKPGQDTDWDKCFARIQDRWKDVGPRCSAIGLINKSKDYNVASAIIYTAAAVACSSACASEWTGAASWTRLLCAGTATAAAIEDVIGNSVTKAEGGKTTAYWATRFGALGAAGSLAAPVASIASGGGLGAVSSTFGKISSCATAMVMVGVATAKYANITIMANSADDECGRIEAHLSKNGEFQSGETGAGGPSGESAPNAGGSGGGGSQAGGSAGGAGGGQGGSGGGYSPAEEGAVRALLDAQYAAAVSGPYGDVFNSIPREAIPKALQQAAGITPRELAQRLRSESPASIVGSLSGGPEGFAATAKAIEKDVLEGKVRIKGDELPSSAMKSGGAAPAASAAKPATSPFLLGMKAPGALGSSGEASFEKMKKAPELQEDGDVFHESYGGTIFQIVSGKLAQTRDRIEELEWDTDLNRALVGLPSRKGAARGHKPASAR